MKLVVMQFLQRSCLHILHSKFRKIRSYDFLSNVSKKKSLTMARQSLRIKLSVQQTKVARIELEIQRLFKNIVKRFPSCHKGQMITMDDISPNKAPIMIHNYSKAEQVIFQLQFYNAAAIQPNIPMSSTYKNYLSSFHNSIDASDLIIT